MTAPSSTTLDLFLPLLSEFLNRRQGEIGRGHALHPVRVWGQLFDRGICALDSGPKVELATARCKGKLLAFEADPLQLITFVANNNTGHLASVDFGGGHPTAVQSKMRTATE